MKELVDLTTTVRNLSRARLFILESNLPGKDESGVALETASARDWPRATGCSTGSFSRIALAARSCKQTTRRRSWIIWLCGAMPWPCWSRRRRALTARAWRRPHERWLLREHALFFLLAGLVSAQLVAIGLVFKALGIFPS